METSEVIETIVVYIQKIKQQNQKNNEKDFYWKI